VAFLTTFATCFSVSDVKQISRAKGLQIFVMWFAFLSTPSFLKLFFSSCFQKKLKILKQYLTHLKGKKKFFSLVRIWLAFTNFRVYFLDKGEKKKHSYRILD
jgi:hypothetical protein